MDNVNQQPVTPQQPPVLETPSLHHRKLKLFVLVLSGFLLLGLGMVIGYFLPKNGNSESTIASTVMETPSPTPLPAQITSIPTIEEDLQVKNWDTYTVKAVNMQFKLPSRFKAYGEMKENITQGEKGLFLCGMLNKKTGFIPQAHAGSPTCRTDSDVSQNYFAVAAHTKDFTFPATLGFSVTPKFVFKDGKYLFQCDEKLCEWYPQESISKVTNANKYEVIKIVGPSKFTHLNTADIINGYGGVINVPSGSYETVVMMFNGQKGFTEDEVDKVLESVQFIN